ncbi:unnamed protein product [Eruca vesicaria subsp. sativa]|uniref:Uncharacterized protein n=1 Tax=Eruca vesicaria subsp. sativa TaxID=29727 RepID=A0ABC8J0I5_ERUVS|nr:unnamed protein product [Eruca vesicaria subsp. sativa]
MQCHLWHCEKAYQSYCSTSHSELAIHGEEGKNAIVIVDGMKDQEVYEISSKILWSKYGGERCGIPHVDPNHLCMNPLELGGFVFNRELEMEETQRSWVFFCEKNPEGFETTWRSSGVSREVSPGISCEKYVLQRAHVSPVGRFLLSKITGGRFSLALYWMEFLAAERKVESEEEGKVTVVTTEAETSSKRKLNVGETSQLPKKQKQKGTTEDIHVENDYPEASSNTMNDVSQAGPLQATYD